MVMQQSAQVVETLLLFGLLVAIVILRRRSIGVQGQFPLERGERLRLMAMEWMEPVLGLIVVCLVLYDELSEGTAHWIAAAVGVVVGVIVGVFRAKLIYVRSEPAAGAVVLRRNRVEYVALAVLLVVNIFAESVKQTSGWLSLLVTAALVLMVAESFTRVTWTTIRYRQAAQSGVHT